MPVHRHISYPAVILNGTYVTQNRIEQLVSNLSDRDRAVLLDLARLRVLRGRDLTRLHFADLAPSSRERTRRRVLARLVEQQLAATLSRTVGGPKSGSSDLVYTLGIAGQRALPLFGSDTAVEPASRARTPQTPGTLFLAHSLAVSRLYVDLRCAERDPTNGTALATYLTEPAAWHPDGIGSVLKPDAYALLQSADVEDSWWLEVDRATESLPTLRKKLVIYVDFARRGSLGPDGVMPRILLTVPSDQRLAAVRDLVASLPAPATQLIFATLHDQAVPFMIAELRAES